MFFVIILLIWGGLHAYVLDRLYSIPFVARHFQPHIFVPIVVFLGLSYIGSRIMEHYHLGRSSHVLEYVGATWVGIFFLVFVCFLAADVCTLFGAVFTQEIVTIRLYALLAAAVLIAIAYIQAWRAPTVTGYEVEMPGLPTEADGLVVVVASDLHLGSMLGHRWATARAAQIVSLKPDLLLLVGDIFEGEKETHAAWLPVLRKFRAPHGVYAVSGNHEFYAGPEPILELMRSAGFHVLRDGHAEVFPGLVIAGVDDPAFRKNGRRDQVVAADRALRDRPQGATIFLSHTPILAQKAAQLGANLMFSGHTHEGQIWPFNYLVRMAFPLLRGRYEVNGMAVIVGRGTGTWGPRMRLWKRSELLCVVLRQSE
ncbi:MAG TPA: metallophosphoesterase [Candidatus Koribacter sp.]